MTDTEILDYLEKNFDLAMMSVPEGVVESWFALRGREPAGLPLRQVLTRAIRLREAKCIPLR